MMWERRLRWADRRAARSWPCLPPAVRPCLVPDRSEPTVVTDRSFHGGQPGPLRAVVRSRPRLAGPSGGREFVAAPGLPSGPINMHPLPGSLSLRLARAWLSSVQPEPNSVIMQPVCLLAVSLSCNHFHAVPFTGHSPPGSLVTPAPGSRHRHHPMHPRPGGPIICFRTGPLSFPQSHIPGVLFRRGPLAGIASSQRHSPCIPDGSVPMHAGSGTTMSMGARNAECPIRRPNGSLSDNIERERHG